MILCCGEALIDMLPAEVTSARPAWAAHPGGAVMNTACALGRLEVPVGLLTGLSTDGFGDMLRGALDAAAVDHALSVTTARKTTLAFVTLVDGQARYSFHDAGSALRMLAPGDMPALPDDVKVLFLGGISLMGEPCGTAFESLLEQAGEGRLVVLDPNIRPGFIEDEPAYRARLERMMARADIVKLSDEDLGWLDGEDGPLERRMEAILARGVKLVIVTRGGAGVTAMTASGLCLEVAARSVRVVDTVGAGDTFNAGLLAGLHDLGALEPGSLATLPEADLRGALAFGCAAAAVVVTRAGAQPPSRAEVGAQMRGAD